MTQFPKRLTPQPCSIYGERDIDAFIRVYGGAM